MTSLIALVLRLALLAVFTFGFVVLFEHGTANFADNAKVEFAALKSFISKEKTEEPPAAATPPVTEPATPPPAPAPVADTTPPPAAPATTPVATPPPTPPPAPTPDNAPSAWEALQKEPIGNGMDIPVAGQAGVTPTPTPTPGN